MSLDIRARWFPSTEADQNLVRRELSAIVASPHFRNSKRYPALLSYVVDRTLDGHAAELKERTLGVEVFERAPDYDTNADPVVRFTAGEIRKRIAQFYHENESHSGLQIDLPPGSYIPEFKLRDRAANSPESAARNHKEEEQESVERAAIVNAPPASQQPDEVTGAGQQKHSVRRIGDYLKWAAIALIAVALVVYVAAKTPVRAQPDDFWAPLLKSPAAVLFVVGNGPHGSLPAPVPGNTIEHGPYDHISFNEAVSLSRLTGVLARQSRQYQVKEADLATLQDMRERSVVFLGAYNNLWTMRLTQALRFHFEKDDLTVRIVDSRSPQQRDWAIDYSKPYSAALDDYAIIARYTDPTTNNRTLIVAGIGAFGTEAASEALASPVDVQKLLAAIPHGSDSSNIEMVIKTAIINGEPAPPQILAITIW